MPSPDPRFVWLLREFRLIVNESIRIALENDVRSRKRLTQIAYPIVSPGHRIYKQYIPSAFEVALSALKVHRRRLRKGQKTTRPWVRRLFLKAENQSYSLDPSSGLLRLPISGRERVVVRLPISAWHRTILSDPSWKLGSLTLTEQKLVVVLSRLAPPPYVPAGALALDTNKETLDGVMTSPMGSKLVSLSLGGISQVQATHFRRKRKLASKKARDRRLGKELISREMRRETNRVRSRLHIASKRVVAAAKAMDAALALESLTLTETRSSCRRRNRELNSWPRGQLHRQIEYKAALAGVPVIKVNPAWTSKTCPVCGARRRGRVGQDFVCELCDWEMDRQHNAGLNILKTALASNEALARAVRFQPGALRHDAMTPACDLSALLRGVREEPSGAEPTAARRSAESKAQVRPIDPARS